MIKYPWDAGTYGAKMAFVERLIELLRIEHNVIGKWFREGITEAEYQTLRAGVQSRMDYRETKLLKVERDTYLTIRFNKKMEKLGEARGQLKQHLFDSTRFSPNLDDDIT